MALWTKAHNVSQSSRALGWDTNNHAANTYRGCGNLSSATFTHTGYTGTELCNDPDTAGGLITARLRRSGNPGHHLSPMLSKLRLIY